jgi:hypothetical protein
MRFTKPTTSVGSQRPVLRPSPASLVSPIAINNKPLADYLKDEYADDDVTFSTLPPLIQSAPTSPVVIESPIAPSLESDRVITATLHENGESLTSSEVIIYDQHGALLIPTPYTPTVVSEPMFDGKGNALNESEPELPFEPAIAVPAPTVEATRAAILEGLETAFLEAQSPEEQKATYDAYVAAQEVALNGTLSVDYNPETSSFEMPASYPSFIEAVDAAFLLEGVTIQEAAAQQVSFFGVTADIDAESFDAPLESSDEFPFTDLEEPIENSDDVANQFDEINADFDDEIDDIESEAGDLTDADFGIENILSPSFEPEGVDAAINDALIESSATNLNPDIDVDAQLIIDILEYPQNTVSEDALQHYTTRQLHGLKELLTLNYGSKALNDARNAAITFVEQALTDPVNAAFKQAVDAYQSNMVSTRQHIERAFARDVLFSKMHNDPSATLHELADDCTVFKSMVMLIGKQLKLTDDDIDPMPSRLRVVEIGKAVATATAVNATVYRTLQEKLKALTAERDTAYDTITRLNVGNEALSKRLYDLNNDIEKRIKTVDGKVIIKGGLNYYLATKSQPSLDKDGNKQLNVDNLLWSRSLKNALRFDSHERAEEFISSVIKFETRRDPSLAAKVASATRSGQRDPDFAVRVLGMPLGSFKTVVPALILRGVKL